MQLRIVSLVWLVVAGCPAEEQPIDCVEEGACRADDPVGRDVYTTACDDGTRLMRTCTPGDASPPACSSAGNRCEVGSLCIDNADCASEMCAVELGLQEGTCIATTSHFGGVCPPNHRVAEERDTDPTTVCLPTGCETEACRIVEVETSFDHHCMREASGKVYCWLASAAPGLPLPGIDDAIDLAGSVRQLCVVRGNGETVCMFDDRPPAAIAARDLVQLAVGFSHSCGVTTSGTVLCWGANDFGQLGDGSFAFATEPVAVVGLDDAVEVAVGREHSCALRQGGAVSCWGRGDMLGSTRANTSAPVAVPGISGASELAIGTTTCVLRPGGGVTCWNDAPMAMSGLAPMIRLEGGDFDLNDGSVFGLMCGVPMTGAAQCWGTGPLPAPGADPVTPQPNDLQAGFDGPAADWEQRPLEGVIELARSQVPACAVLTTGEVFCGSNTMTPVPGTQALPF